MNTDDLKGLKYFIGVGLLVVGFYAYSGMVGWRWFGGTTTTEEKSEGTRTHSGGRYLLHHK